jgi:hypothetical protein
MLEQKAGSWNFAAGSGILGLTAPSTAMVFSQQGVLASKFP